PRVSTDVREVTCPYTGERLAAIPALRPDVALVHAQRADADGNLQVFGLPGDSVDGAMASERIVATVEEVVSREVIRGVPDRTVIPGFRVAAVSHVPCGAHPSYVEGHYGRDDEAYFAWGELARAPDRLRAWIDAEIRGVPDFAAHLARLGPERLERLRDLRRALGDAP
ncbi:MAG: CoA-transferase, partial [Geminicoccales bacterium]